MEKDPNIILKEFEQRLSSEKPEIVVSKVFKLKRNQTIVKNMKDKYNHQCQMCGFTFQKKSGGYYSEVAHINPLNSAQEGVDAPSNMIVLCPNHHKMLDLGNIRILSKSKYEIDGIEKAFETSLF